MAHDKMKQMESAIALAEELSFTRAAIKRHISQPTFTKHISDLESDLGIELFERDKRKVAVTDAGRAYIHEARIAVLHSSRADHAARAAKHNAELVLNVGKSPYTDPFLTSTLLSIHLPLFPRLRIEVTSQYSCDLARELLAGGLDLAIATEPPESPLLTTVKVAEAPFYIAMSRRDELARQPSVTLDAMARRCWVLFERRLHPPVYDSVMRLAEERKIKPAKIQHITAPEEAYAFVADGRCVAFLVKAGALIMARNGITVRPLVEEALSLKTYLASRADNESKVASELVRAFMRKVSDVGESKQLLLPISA
jgi:DNA-binding transcriptional LysR family regulator